MRISFPRRRSERASSERVGYDRLVSSPDETSPYLAARREWNERYGSYVQQAANWRLATFGALAVALVAVGWAGYRSSESRFIPYVVQVDKLGDAVAVGPVSTAPVRDNRVIVAQLARWVFDVRSVFHDARAENVLLADSYQSVAPDSQALASINQWLRAHNPFKRGHDTTVSVSVHDVLPISANVYRVTWTERVRGRNTGTVDVSHWSAIITIKIEPPSSAAAIMKNPMGVYITNFSWSRSVT